MGDVYGVLWHLLEAGLEEIGRGTGLVAQVHTVFDVLMVHA